MLQAQRELILEGKSRAETVAAKQVDNAVQNTKEREPQLNAEKVGILRKQLKETQQRQKK